MSELALASGFSPPKGPSNNPPRVAGASVVTHPLVVADRELHCELRLGLKERGGREEGRVREHAEVLSPEPWVGLETTSTA